MNPLVTFLLVTYNQEYFVADAIKGALSQTYAPLEIIITDDCSTDQTFDRAKKELAGYRGQHRIHLTQTPNNSGTFANVMHGLKAAQGELIVLAAGDDISKPERVEQLVSSWQMTKAWGLQSGFDRIDAEGNLIGEAQYAKGLSDLSPDAGFGRYFCGKDGPVRKVHGAGSAYDARVFEYLREFSGIYSTSEDGVFSFVINLLGERILVLDESLLHYREHEDATCNTGEVNGPSTMADIIATEQKHILRMMSYANNNKLFLDLIDSLGDQKLRQVNKEVIAYERKRHAQKARWRESKFVERVKFILTFRHAKDLKWMLPRLLGEKPFYLFKYLVQVKFRSQFK